MGKKEDDTNWIPFSDSNKLVWKLFAESNGIESGNAYKHLFENHSHPLGDDGEDMVTVKVALEAIKIAEKEVRENLSNKD